MASTEHPVAASQSGDVSGNSHGSVMSKLSTGAVRLFAEYTGRGPTKARTAIHRDSITILMEDLLTKGERSLVANGRTELVLSMRREFQETMRDDLVRMVEVIMEREVIAFMSSNHIDPDMAAEVFVLEPAVEASP
jgi:uncharacterized protein YbcI